MTHPHEESERPQSRLVVYSKKPKWRLVVHSTKRPQSRLVVKARYQPSKRRYTMPNASVGFQVQNKKRRLKRAMIQEVSQ